MVTKNPLPIEQQLDLLNKRGLVIDNPALAAKFLIDNNYYRLNIYFHKCMDGPDHFPDSLSFSKIISIYQYDQWLRNKILLLLEPIEIKIKSHTAYYLSMKYGSDCFYNELLYLDKDMYNVIHSSLDKEISRNKNDPMILHHIHKYEGVFPIWVVVELLTFNSISKFYKILPDRDKKEISFTSFSINEYYLEQWLHCLSVLRNICAHYGYLYRRKFTVRPKIYRDFGYDSDMYGSLYALILVINKLSNKNTFQQFINYLKIELSKDPTIDLSSYGFINGWEKHLALLLK